VIGTAAAVANAIYHATGKRLYSLPMKIDDLLQSWEGESGSSNLWFGIRFLYSGKFSLSLRRNFDDPTFKNGDRYQTLWYGFTNSLIRRAISWGDNRDE
jgi:hypothetical protein